MQGMASAGRPRRRRPFGQAQTHSSAPRNHYPKVGLRSLAETTRYSDKSSSTVSPFAQHPHYLVDRYLCALHTSLLMEDPGINRYPAKNHVIALPFEFTPSAP